MLDGKPITGMNGCPEICPSCNFSYCQKQRGHEEPHGHCCRTAQYGWREWRIVSLKHLPGRLTALDIVKRAEARAALPRRK